MKNAAAQSELSPELLAVHVVEPGVRPKASAVCCKIGENVKFSTDSLKYSSRRGNRSLGTLCWCRRRGVRGQDETPSRLHVAEALELPSSPSTIRVCGIRRRSKRRCATPWSFLPAMNGTFEFVARKKDVERPAQIQLSLNPQIEAVIPFSNGLDSCAVAGLMGRRLGDKLVRIRLGSGQNEARRFRASARIHPNSV